MPNFPIPATAYTYRPLKKGLSGWDIYALQTALKGAGFYNATLDGIAGTITDTGIRNYQTASALVSDGIAGIVTQRSLALRDAFNSQQKYGLPTGALKGQIEAESGYILGNHTAQYSNHTWDTGVAQRNTAYATPSEGFNAPQSLDTLASQIRSKHDQYRNYGVVRNERRLWELAQGSWNRPAWTDLLAQGKPLADDKREWIEGYIDRVTVYLVV